MCTDIPIYIYVQAYLSIYIYMHTGSIFVYLVLRAQSWAVLFWGFEAYSLGPSLGLKVWVLGALEVHTYSLEKALPTSGPQTLQEFTACRLSHHFNCLCLTLQFWH